MNFRDLPKHDPDWNLLTIKESQMQFVKTEIESNKFKLATKGPSIIFVQGLFLNQFTVWSEASRVRIYSMKKITFPIKFIQILKSALSGWRNAILKYKNVLTICEKILLQWSRKVFDIWDSRLKICKIFEISRTMYSHSEK